MSKDDIFFTTVKSPRNFRRELLLSSKELITILRDYQSLLDLRKEKKHQIGQLKRQFHELHSLMEKLDKFLPEDSLEKLKELLPKQKSEPKPKKKSPTVKKGTQNKKTSKTVTVSKAKPKPKSKREPKEDTEIAKLEKVLHGIEQKLESL